MTAPIDLLVAIIITIAIQGQMDHPDIPVTVHMMDSCINPFRGPSMSLDKLLKFIYFVWFFKILFGFFHFVN